MRTARSIAVAQRSDGRRDPESHVETIPLLAPISAANAVSVRSSNAIARSSEPREKHGPRSVRMSMTPTLFPTVNVVKRER